MKLQGKLLQKLQEELKKMFIEIISEKKSLIHTHGISKGNFKNVNVVFPKLLFQKFLLKLPEK